MPQKKGPYGPALQKARHAAGLTQRELAERLGCTVIWVSGMENDHRRPNIPGLEAIAKACSCTFVIDGRGMRMV